ncbi:hypothetical protein CGQ21_28270, partial [Klebsiella pneumoniae]
MGRFPHGSRARQGGPIPTRQRRPARRADSHTAAAPGTEGGIPDGRRDSQGGGTTRRGRAPRAR